MTIYVSVTATLIMLIKKVLKTKLSPKLNFFMWILLLGVFLLPVMPKTKFSIYNFIQKEKIEKYVKMPVIINDEKVYLLISKENSIKTAEKESILGTIENLNNRTDEVKLNFSYEGVLIIIYYGIIQYYLYIL